MLRLAVLTIVAFSAFSPIAAQPLTFTQLSTRTAAPPDHCIKYGDNSLQFGNLRLPRRLGPHPVIVYVHGGCWLSQYDIAHAAAVEQALADSGFAVWSLEYRHMGNEGGGWPGTFTDIAKGADYLRELTQVEVVEAPASGHFDLLAPDTTTRPLDLNALKRLSAHRSVTPLPSALDSLSGRL